MTHHHHEYIAEIDGPQSYRGADRTRRFAKGGGGGDTYYANADKLYGVQADTAGFMLGMGKQYLPGATEGYFTATRDLFDPAYAARMEGLAGITAQQAIDANRESRRRDMARYGINPGEGTWRSALNADAMHGAALKAGSINAARMGVADRRLGAAKDFYSALVGMPSDAAATAASAAGGYANLGAMADQRQANTNAALGNVAALGYEVFFAADGGEVPPLRRVSDEVWAAGERYYAPGGVVNRSPTIGDESTPESGSEKFSKTLALMPATRFVVLGLPKRSERKEQPDEPAPVGENIYAPEFDRSRMHPTQGKRLVSDDAAHYARGGQVQIKDGARCMALGGLFKQPPAPPLGRIPVRPQQQQNSVAPIRAGVRGAKLASAPSKFVDKMTIKGGKIAETAGNLLGDQQLAAQGLGMQGAGAGTDMSAAINAYQQAGVQDVAAGLAKGAGMDAVTGLTPTSAQAAQLLAQTGEFGAAGAAATTEALASTAPAALAEGTSALATTGASAALGTAAAAIPWIGAAVALGSLFDLFNEGGEVVNGRKDYTPGGAVTGPGDGTTTSDMVPAWLTEGEFVVNAEAVNLGDNRKRLQEMNRKGLAIRAVQQGVGARKGDQRRAAF